MEGFSTSPLSRQTLNEENLLREWFPLWHKLTCRKESKLTSKEFKSTIDVGQILRINPTAVNKTCTHKQFKNKPFAQWKHATVGRGDDTPKSLSCEGVFHKFFDLKFFDKKPVIVMTACQHNEINSFHQRYLKESPELGDLDYGLVNEIIKDMAEQLKPHFNGPITIQEFLKDKKGKLATRYRNAYNKLYNNNYDLKDISRMSAFIKSEKYNDESKSPRFIMGRDPMFNLLYGLYTTPMEHAFTKLPQVAKGKNFLERGRMFADMQGGWFLENDFSKFEGSQRLEVLVIEKMLFKELLTPDEYKEYQLCWREKMTKKGYTQKGIKFSFQGCRGSGDMDTGLGNTLLNYVAMKYFLIKNGVPSDKFIVDGDDSVASIPASYRQYVNYFLDFGFDAKLMIKRDYHDVEFCSSNFIQITPGKFYQVQNLSKLLSNIGTILNPEFVPAAGDYYASLGYMYQTCYKGIPIYEDLGRFLRGFAGDKHYCKTEYANGSYGISEAFKHSRNVTFDVDAHLAYVEIMMVCNISALEVEHLYKQLSAKVEIPVDYTRELKTKTTKPIDTSQMVNPFHLVGKQTTRLWVTKENRWVMKV